MTELKQPKRPEPADCEPLDAYEAERAKRSAEELKERSRVRNKASADLSRALADMMDDRSPSESPKAE